MSVIIGDGPFTSFWSDHLIGSAPLELTIQALFSHALRPNISVRSAAENGHWGLHLQPRLTLLAQQELSTLLQALQDVQLSPAVPDRRGIRTMLTPFSTKFLYHALSPVVPPDEFLSLIWCTFATPQAKQFLWLIHRHRLPTAALLHHRNIIDSDEFCTAIRSKISTTSSSPAPRQPLVGPC